VELGLGEVGNFFAEGGDMKCLCGYPEVSERDVT